MAAWIFQKKFFTLKFITAEYFWTSQVVASFAIINQSTRYDDTGMNEKQAETRSITCVYMTAQHFLVISIIEKNNI